MHPAPDSHEITRTRTPFQPGSASCPTDSQSQAILILLTVTSTGTHIIVNAALRRGVFTGVGWQEPLCDPI